MKSIFKLLSITIGLILVIASCSKDEIRPHEKNKLEIRFENTSSDKIKNLKFQGKSIGDIKKNSKTKYYSFKEIRVMEKNVMESASAKSDYGRTDSWISTSNEEQWTTLTSGKHTINVALEYWCGVGLILELKE